MRAVLYCSLPCRAGVKGMIVLLPLLGLTWVFGIMAINKDTIAFQYLFAILNSLQVYYKTHCKSGVIFSRSDYLLCASKVCNDVHSWPRLNFLIKHIENASSFIETQTRLSVYKLGMQYYRSQIVDIFGHILATWLSFEINKNRNLVINCLK